MVGQARARDATAVAHGQVDLRHGSVAHLPFADDTFDAALAINSMQVWPDAIGGLREMRRVVKRFGRIALGFTPPPEARRAGGAWSCPGFVDGE
jgi:ubiquinone/menaquinone biosynthesis C-methylase UbiE